MSKTDKQYKHLSMELASAGREFYRRGWVLGTSGNFSMLLARKPLRMCVTASGVEKGELDETNFLELDDNADIIDGFGKPSAETLLHLCIYRHVARARSILHTHSVWGTILSDRYYEQGAIEIEGYEMLKGLSGVSTHEHLERVPVVDNSQDYVALSHVIENVLRENPTCHGIYLRRHGLYTWGETVADARRHIEIFEFLFEVLGRQIK
ncbi:methylthioribulose 1-phosphate dehydratase [Leptolyngbya sp. 7M]|uniref:methylthioribulose 1-phosphate dehydratase n=1 Tax=Leptolyngbya sp. 7M TaxID=2812896 RepID=UPI001B8B9B7C|nr:methylthioribulose 1-phosphate dehydratase [Leptolyngbya sp. 7M]QYO67244.1 methylthioribulose 1-phosphate dehydratase [Leptolyngbya sp. 7M]